MILGFKIGFLDITTIDVIDILLVTFILYQLYKLLRGSVAVKIFLGILSIYLFYLVVKAVKMELLTSILGQFINVGVIAALILFQQEIRKFLVLVGKTTAFNNDNLFRGWPWRRRTKTSGYDLAPVVDAAKILGGTNTGALVVFSRSSELKFYAESGDLIDAILSKRLLLSIFQKNSPMHDGAVIIANNRIKAARCILPVSENEELPANFGLRHRAALGMTEVTDSVVMIVSEETGEIAVAFNGKLFSNLSKNELKQKLSFYLFEDEKKLKTNIKELNKSAKIQQSDSEE